MQRRPPASTTAVQPSTHRYTGPESRNRYTAPLIVEWRRVRSDFTDAKDRLSKLMAEERMLR